MCSSEVICASDPQKLALTSPTSGGRLVGIVRSQTQAMELVSYIVLTRCCISDASLVTWLVAE
jgi:hypothetical protein